MYRLGAFIFIFIFCFHAVSANAQVSELDLKALYLTEELSDGPFNPENLRQDHERLIMSAALTGDDYNWPLWTLAIVESCPGTQTTCSKFVLKARVLRVIPQEGTRYRRVGSKMVYDIAEKLLAGETLDSAFDDAPVEWLFANIKPCNGARQQLDLAPVQKWIIPNFPKATGPFYLHTDMIKIKVHTHQYTLEFQGAPDRSDNPAQWANDLYHTISPCLTTSYMTPPWERSARD